MSLLPCFEVEVSIRNATGERGRHIFTGKASLPREALTRGHEVYEAVVTAQQNGLERPDREHDGWGARGIRDGWELDWTAATASPWTNPNSHGYQR
ncbi:hypothetical protein H4W23_39690 [Streptomyces gardneri]|uniref:hypothetical protein n=1 Tax=Streptomyces gardneri TaxID=66892 RepID=UPI0006BC7A28|nr:hypothetical protein [Streptomyces gardneri]QPK50117.1 hypothetical protein H4W23_39690 [Streptomyces gardneri]WRK41705.1 hypothetical protein U0M97_39920 [Streptomyces venezuelae]CUM35762.1 hypothetical protein BN2537_489 [Streptomyces venezuelae]